MLYLSYSGRLLVWVLLLTLKAGLPPGNAASAERSIPQKASTAHELFSDVSRQVGLEFIHFNGMSGEFYYPEVVGPGAAFVDYDSDGDLDIYLVQGHMLGTEKKLDDAFFPPPSGTPLSDRLYRNDLVVNEDGTRSFAFTDVTRHSGIQALGYGLGVTAGDFNNDGWTDIYVTNFGSDQLLRNNGDGTFRDVTRAAGIDNPGLSVSSAFFDYDRDGWLDLIVVNHVKFDFENHKPCASPFRGRDYCATQMYPAMPSRLFHNLGNGTFEDVTVRSGIHREYGAGLGVVTADINGDDWGDIYIANDGTPNQLWINQKDGSFRNEALLAGAAVNMDGAAEASMGVDVGDFDGDGDLDLFMTHDSDETNTIYVNDGNGWFHDRSAALGLAAPSQGYTGFGTAWFDYNNDGWLDLFIANGAVRTESNRANDRRRYPLDQTNQLFANLGNGHFQETTYQAGKVFDLSAVSRGAAFGDVDNDGDADILVVNNSGPARLLLNNDGHRRRWLGLRLVSKFKRDALGAKLRITRDSGPPLWRWVRTDGSYASANDPRVLVGLGESKTVRAVRVYWSHGGVEEWHDLPTGRYTVLREGEGKSATMEPGK